MPRFGGDQPEPEGVSLRAVFADAVLKSKDNLDQVEEALDGLAELPTEEVPVGLASIMPLLMAQTALGAAYAGLAAALQHGAPGDRF
jgi:hypothetical protein